VRGTTTAKGMNRVDDVRVAAGLAPKVAQNVVTVPGIVKHVLLFPNERILQAKIPTLLPVRCIRPDVKPIEQTFWKFQKSILSSSSPLQPLAGLAFEFRSSLEGRRAVMMAGAFRLLER
jgi:hypothetical protein